MSAFSSILRSQKMSRSSTSTLAANDQASFTSPLLIAVLNLASRLANSFANCLLQCGIAPETYQAPQAFTLEVSALLQLAEWERSGISGFIPGLPTTQHAREDFLERLKSNPRSFDVLAGAVLMRRVLQAFASSCSWDSRDAFDADIVVGEIDEDLLAEKLASLVYQRFLQLT